MWLLLVLDQTNVIMVALCNRETIYIFIFGAPLQISTGLASCFEVFFAPQGRHVAPMGVKFGMEEGPLLHAKFHPHRCNVSLLRVEKPQNRPLSSLNYRHFDLRATLSVNERYNRKSHFRGSTRYLRHVTRKYVWNLRLIQLPHDDTVYCFGLHWHWRRNLWLHAVAYAVHLHSIYPRACWVWSQNSPFFWNNV